MFKNKRRKYAFMGIILVLAICVSVFSTAKEHEKLKAYRDIQFKDSRETVKSKIEKDTEIKPSAVEDLYSTTVNGETFYLQFFYYQNQLSLINFATMPKKEYKPVLNKLKKMTEVLKEAYGEPTRRNYGAAEELGGKGPGSSTWIYKWDLGDKYIASMLKYTENYKWNAMTIITYLPLSKKKIEQSKEEKEEKEKESASDF